MSEQETNPSVTTSLTSRITKEGSPNILVVDDNLVLLNLFDKILKKLGFQVLLSHNGKEALNLVRKTSPDVVLLDIKMPEMDGITVLKEIKAIDPDIEVVIMTGYASLDSALDALKYGAFDYLRKPFDKQDQVTNAICQAWERRKPRLEGRSLKTSQERSIYEFKSLYNISRVLGNCLDHQEMIGRLLDSLSKIMEYDVGGVILTEKSGQKRLILQIVKPSSPIFVEEVKQNLIDAFNAVSLLKISPKAASDIIIGEGNIKPENQNGERIAEDLSSFLNVPMMKEGMLMGMINVSSHRDRSFSPDDIRLMYAIVSQVASAIQRLHGIRAVERSWADKLAQSMTEGVIIIDENLDLVLVNSIAQRILGQPILNLKLIQNTLGLDLNKLKTRMEKEQLELVKHDAKINSNSYDVSISIIKETSEAFMGFVISLRRSGKEEQN